MNRRDFLMGIPVVALTAKPIPFPRRLLEGITPTAGPLIAVDIEVPAPKFLGRVHDSWLWEVRKEHLDEVLKTFMIPQPALERPKPAPDISYLYWG